MRRTDPQSRSAETAGTPPMSRWRRSARNRVLIGFLVMLVGVMASGAATFSHRVPVAIAQSAPSPTPRSLPTAPATATATPRVITIGRLTPTSAPSPTSAPTPREIVEIAPTATTAPTPTSLPSPPPTAIPTLPPTAVPAVIAPTLAPVQAVRIAFAAEDWVGGYYRGDSRAYGRPWVAVYGARSAYPRAALDFTLDATPGAPAGLTITGLDDELVTSNEIAVEVNGQDVFRGPSPFLNWDGVGNGANAAWTSAQFTIPAGVLRAGPNEIVVANLSPSANFNAPPYVLLADALLEVPGAEREKETPTSMANFTAADWAGGFYRGDSRFYGRPWVAVYGALSAYPRATLTFALDAKPRDKATLTLTGLDDEWADLNPMEIDVNGQAAFTGASPFVNWDGVGNGANAAWTQVSFTLPARLFRAGQNEITIANLSPAANFNAPPYILLADAALETPGAAITGPNDSERKRGRRDDSGQ